MPIESESKSGNLDSACNQQRGQWGTQQDNSRDGASLTQEQLHPENIPFHEAPQWTQDGRRSAGISHHGEGATYEWQWQIPHKSHAASYLQPTHQEELNSMQHTMNDCGANGHHGEAISSWETDVRVLSSSRGNDPTSRACSNAYKMDSLKRRLAEVRDRTVSLIRNFNHRCIKPKFPAGIFPVKFRITAKGRYHLLHKKNENYTLAPLSKEKQHS